MSEQLILKLRQQGVRIRSEGDRIVFDAPPGVVTPELAKQLRENKDQIMEFLSEESAAAAPEYDFVIPVISRELPIPLSFAQESLWFLDQVTPDTASYNIPLRLRISSEIDQDALRQSLNEIVRRHEILRTCFQTVVGRPIQKIGPPSPLWIPFMDLTCVPKELREEQADRLCREHAARPFVLDRDSMFRVVLFKLEKENYILLLNLHHIASDAWSIEILLGELAALYDAYSKGRPSPLQELPVQYADYAAWQRSELTGEVISRQLNYWRRRLDGALPLLDLPTEWPRPAVQTFRGSVETTELPASLATALKALSQGEGVSLFMTLLAAFYTLLYRYSGQQDITIGSPISNRNKTGLEALIGLFVNALPLRIDLSGNSTFRQLLSRVREVVLGAYENQTVPFEALVTDLKPERDLSHSPLFQVFFAIENARPGPANFKVQTDFVSTATSKFDLSLYIREFSGGMSAELEYCTDLYGRETIRRMLDHFTVLLKGIVENPDEHLSTLPLLTSADREHLLIGNQTKVEFGRDLTLDELIEKQSKATPDRVAVRFGDGLLTYRELDERAHEVARYLRVSGVGPNDVVGLYVERSLDMVVGLLGILKTGGAYLPLDPLYPPDRLAFMLEDARPVTVLTLKRLERALSHVKTKLVFIDDLPNLGLQHTPAVKSTRHRRPSDLAYVIYTSGSTGIPKGVQIAHRSVVNFLYSMQQKPGLAENDVLLAVTTLSFDIAALELFLPLIVGAQVVIASVEAAADAEQLVSLLKRHEITVMQATPTTWYLLLEAGWIGNPRLKILCGGEAWSSQLANQLLSRCGSLWNMYGPTETTVWSSVNEIKRDERVLIGAPIANTGLYVLQKDLQLAPLLVPGELYIGGEGVARGYLNRPDLTDEKFIFNPFSQNKAERFYKTGDLVRMLPNGALEFLGRIDNQVKIRGFRIELDEIATILRQHPAVKDAVVVLQQGDSFDRRLEAYIIANQGQSLNRGDLQAFLKRQLPFYMVPTAFEIIDRFPMTPTGKIDRKALENVPARRPEGKKSSVPPLSLTELVVAEVWEEILGVEDIGASDDFFDLGGHSLLIVQMIHQINARCKARLGVPDLFRNPTLEQLATVIESHQSDGRQEPAVIQLQAGHDEIPLYFIYAGPDEFQLARLMGTHRPIFGIQVPWPLRWRQAVAHNQLSSFPTMDEFVAPFVKALSAHVGSAPFMIAGHSFAGIIAFEAAHQLQMRGAKVDTVIIIDKWWRYPNPFLVAWENVRRCWTEAQPDPKPSFVRLTLNRCLRTALIIWWPLKLTAKEVLPSLSPGELTTTFDEEGVPVRWGLMARLYSRLEQNLKPRVLDCRGIIFRTDFMDHHHSVRVLDEGLGWQGLFSRGLESISVSGDHISIFRQNNQLLASMINKVLERHGDL